MIVVDTSAILDALIGRPPTPGLVDRLSGDGDLHAPHLIDMEVVHALRRLVSLDKLTEDRAADARADYVELPIVRYGHLQLLERMWELRNNLTAYDAAFVALSEALDIPMITCDTRLASASGHQARVEVFGRR